MIGDDYFELRSQLGAQLHVLASIIRDLGGDTESIAIIENLIASLKEPFVFVVVGEVNVGKSTFLNALFGQDFSRTGVMPTTDKILFFKHGPELLTVPITPTLEEVHVPADFLRDFHIVDTPGTNSIENEHQQITERFVPIADLVIFVFSAMNPWGASAWQFLDKVHKQWMRNVIFILQQCDLRSPEEIQVITDYMGQLSRQRYGRDFPLFPISAKKAYLARSSGVDRERLLQESGFLHLETHLSTLVGRNAARLNKLASTARLAHEILGYYREQISSAVGLIQRRGTLLREMQTERELQVDRTMKKILPALDATERDYHECCLRVAGLADQALATREAFKAGEDGEEYGGPPQSLDHRLFQDLQHRTSDRWRQVGIILEEDYLQFRRYLHVQARDTLPISTDLTEPEQDMRRVFAAHVDSTIRRFVLGLKLDESLEPGLLKARKRARWVPWLVLPVVPAVAAAWYWDGPLAAAIAATGGLLLIGFAFLITQAALAQTRRMLIDRLEQATATLRQMLAQQVEDDVQAVFSRFITLISPAHDQTSQQEQQLAAQADKLRELAESLKGFEGQLRTVQPKT